MTTVLGSCRLLIGALGITLALAGCGSASTASAPATSAPATGASSAASTPTSSNTPSSDPGVGSCPGSSDLATALTSTANVTKVSIIGGCHEASIDTSLAPGMASVSAALTICDAAAKVAYAQGLLSVTVSGTDGHELAAGLRDSQCIGG